MGAPWNNASYAEILDSEYSVSSTSATTDNLTARYGVSSKDESADCVFELWTFSDRIEFFDDPLYGQTNTFLFGSGFSFSSGILGNMVTGLVVTVLRQCTCESLEVRALLTL